MPLVHVSRLNAGAMPRCFARNYTLLCDSGLVSALYHDHSPLVVYSILSRSRYHRSCSMLAIADTTNSLICTHRVLKVSLIASSPTSSFSIVTYSRPNALESSTCGFAEEHRRDVSTSTTVGAMADQHWSSLPIT